MAGKVLWQMHAENHNTAHLEQSNAKILQKPEKNPVLMDG